MFTGLVEDVGAVLWLRVTEDGTHLEIEAPDIAAQIHSGDSVAVNGCCLTVSAHRGANLTFDLLGETLNRTNLRHLRRGTLVNLERALAADGRLGGHFVQGHIDCAVRVLAFDAAGQDHRVELELPSDFRQYVVSKGSIAINGISLTVAEVLPQSFTSWIIPFTKNHTNLDSIQPGDCVNLEFDILAKYVERMLPQPASLSEP